MPSSDLGDLLVTDWAETALFFPKIDEPLFPLVGVYHLDVEAFFVVGFSLRIIRIGLSTDLDVSFDRNMCGVCEIMGFLFNGSGKHPIVFSDGFEVFLRSPCIGFSWVSSSGPLSHETVNSVIYSVEGGFAYDVSVIACPSPDDGIELHDQFSSTESFICLHDVPYLL